MLGMRVAGAIGSKLVDGLLRLFKIKEMTFESHS